MSQQVNTGEADWSIRLWAYDSAGEAVTGLVYNSAGVAVSVVVRSKGRIVSTTALTLVPRSGAGVHTDSAFTEVGGGEYVVDLPDSYIATAERTISLTVAATAITGTVIVETLEVGRTAVLDSAGQDWTAEEREQIRYRLGLNGTATAPTPPTTDPIVITPGDEDATTAWLVVRDGGDASLPDADVRIQMLAPDGSSTGSLYTSTIRTETSSDVGVVEFRAKRGGTYRYWLAGKPDRAGEYTIPTDAGDTTALPDIVN